MSEEKEKRDQGRRVTNREKATLDVAIYVASTEAHGANEGEFKQLLCSREIPYYLLHCD